jgi:hypothetical protein
MDIVSKITSYAKAVPAGLKAASQELAKTAVAVTGADARPRRKAKRAGPKKKTAKRAAAATPPKGKPKAKRAAAKPKGRKAKR